VVLVVEVAADFVVVVVVKVTPFSMMPVPVMVRLLTPPPMTTVATDIFMTASGSNVTN
jgi:hypothetical protein